MTEASDTAAKIQALYGVVLGRRADAGELDLAQRFLQMTPANGAGGLSPWAQYAQALLLSNEFAFVD